MIEVLHEVVADFVGEHRIVQVNFGNPGMLPISTSSMLGCVAAVIETESPSQPSPAVIQTM